MSSHYRPAAAARSFRTRPAVTTCKRVPGAVDGDTLSFQVLGTDGTNTTQTATVADQFHFTGTGSDPSIYTAVVNLGNNQSAVVTQNGALTVPTGTSGMIVPDASGGYDVEVGYANATVNENFPVQVIGSDGTTYTGTTTNSDTTQFHFASPAGEPDYVYVQVPNYGNIYVDNIANSTVSFGNGGQIQLVASGDGYNVVIHDPNATPGETYNLQYAVNFGTLVSGTATYYATYHFAATGPISDYTALVNVAGTPWREQQWPDSGTDRHLQHRGRRDGWLRRADFRSQCPGRSDLRCHRGRNRRHLGERHGHPRRPRSTSPVWERILRPATTRFWSPTPAPSSMP